MTQKQNVETLTKKLRRKEGLQRGIHFLQEREKRSHPQKKRMTVGVKAVREV